MKLERPDAMTESRVFSDNVQEDTPPFHRLERELEARRRAFASQHIAVESTS